MQQPIVDYDANTDINRGYFDNGVPDDGIPMGFNAEAFQGLAGLKEGTEEAVTAEATAKAKAESWDTRILGHIVYVGDAVYKIVKSENGYLLMQFQDLTGAAKRRIAGHVNRNVRKGQGRRQFKRNG